MTLPLDGLDLLNAPVDLLGGAPLQLPLDLIDEDPDQPRKDFCPTALAELAESIKVRGVLQAISVRRHPNKADHWMVNFGARRLRASYLAGKATIPAYVDNAMDSYDQVIENEQRECLSPLELAMFMQKQLQLGASASEIARTLGKSRGYLTFIGALIDPPAWLLDLYRSGRCRGMSELYELRKLHISRPEEVTSWLEGRAHVSRGDVLAFKDRLALVVQTASTQATAAIKLDPAALPGSMGAQSTEPDAHLDQQASLAPDFSRPASKHISRNVVLLGVVDGLQVRVPLEAKAIGEGRILVGAMGSEKQWWVAADAVTFLRLEVLERLAG